jgi:hypothetical protein
MRNRLEIGTNGNGLQCSATLARAPGTTEHTIEVHTVVVTNGIASGAEPAGLIIADETTIGELELDEGTEMSVEAPLSVENNSSNTSGKFFADGTVTFTSTSSPSTIHEFAVRADPFSTAVGVVNLLPGADVTALTASKIASLNIGQDAQFTMQQRPGSPPTPADAHVLMVRNLHIDKTPSLPLGKLDLTNNAMIVDHDGESPIDDVEDLIGSAYAVGAWTGDGLTSSTAAAVAADTGNQYKTGIGYAEATDLFTFPLPNPPPTFEGVVPDSTMVLVKYTYYGDATLDGVVNLADFNRLASNFGQPMRRWSQGDFNYDGNANLADFNRLATNFGRFDLGGSAQDVDDVSPEELQDMWEDATG